MPGQQFLQTGLRQVGDAFTSNVSVTSSPIFDSLSDPQHAQDVGAGTTTRSHGRCSGNGLRNGLRRTNPLTSVLPVEVL